MIDESSQETIENDALAASFQDELIKELIRRGVKFEQATAENFSDVNIDVRIHIEGYFMRYLFKYIGIGYLRGRILSEMSLEAYVKRYVEHEIKDLREDIDWQLRGLPEQLRRNNIWESHRADLQQRLDNARKIAEWLYVVTK